jgi:hypothetical protein
MRQRPTAHPIATLPTMLNKPGISDQAPYCTGRPQVAITPGNFVPRKATCKPQAQNPAAASKTTRTLH